jgi:crotonobetainyl-CoA:carnitine CoA-transferase CaiB-like acyl-CoA transferase
MPVKPLEKVTIVELSTMVTAALAAMMAADQGARVIKVEATEGGDPMRYLGSSKGGSSGLFANSNRGKESVCVDLKQAEGQRVVRSLVKEADVVVTNFRPGVMDKLGLGSELLRAANPRLIFLAITGYGTAGPLAQAPAYDPVVQAHSGLAAVQGSERAEFVRNLMCDKITAYTACQALTAALYQREHTGVGQHIDLSMLDSSLAFLFPDGFMNHTLLDEDVERQPALAESYNPFQTADGTLAVAAMTAAQIARMLRALDLDSMLEDERFKNIQGLQRNRAEYLARLGEAFSRLDTATAMARLQENDVPVAKCLALDEVLEDAQVAANDSILTQEHPQMGHIRLVRAPARFGGEPLAPASHSPGLGEHTVSVLRSHGISEAEIERLAQRGVIAG